MISRKRVLVCILIFVVAFAVWANDDEGLLIRSIVDDSPAERAGLLRGDILLEVDGNEIDTAADVRRILSDMRAGQKVTLRISRGGKTQSVEVILEERLYRPALGLEFEAVSRDFNFGPVVVPRAAIGVIIAEVQEGSPADRAGLEDRDAILSIDGDRVPANEFRDVILSHSPGDRIVLQISRPGDDGDKPFPVTVELGDNDGQAFLGIRYAAPGMLIERRSELQQRFQQLENEMRRRLDERSDGSIWYFQKQEDDSDV